MEAPAPQQHTIVAGNDRSGSRIPQLDAMRGLAALIVCLHHAVLLIPWTDSSLLSRLFRRVVLTVLDGATMVDFFFVLSGFVLALPYFGPNGRRFDMCDFLVRRAARIYPAFWVAMLFALVLRLVSGDAFHLWASTDLGRLQWNDPITVRNLLVQFTLVFGLANVHMLNAPIWSICVEMQVALILPLFFFLIGPMRSARMVLAANGLSLVIAYMIGPPSPMIFLPLFVMGVSAAWFRPEVKERVTRLSRSTSIGLGLIALTLVFNRAVTTRIGWQFPDLRPELIAGFGAIMLIVLADGRQEFASLLVRPPFLLLGKASYSIYLLHTPIFLWLFPIIDHATGSLILCTFAGIALSLVLALVVFHAVEEPGIAIGRWLAKSLVQTMQSSSVPVSNAAQPDELTKLRGMISPSVAIGDHQEALSNS